MVGKILSFGRDLVRDGYTLVSVIAPLLSIAFTLAKAVDMPELSHLREISYAWAFAPIIVWLLIAYVRRHSQAQTLQATLVPKLKCSFDMNEPGCVRPNTKIVAAPNQHVIATWYRVKVEAINAVNLNECRGRLVEVRRAGSNLLLGETPSLHFAQGDALSKTISPGVPEYLDFLMANDTNGAFVTAHPAHLSQAVQWNEIFRMAGDYNLRIVITSSNSSPVGLELLFRWTLIRAPHKF